jgi:hypothetical protein
MNNQTNSTTKIINDSIDKNMDTFLKWIEFAHKFYYDLVQSYYDYVVKINKSPPRESYHYWLTKIYYIIVSNVFLVYFPS